MRRPNCIQHDPLARRIHLAPQLAHRLVVLALTLVGAVIANERTALAQLAALSDEIILLSKGLQQQERNRTTTPLGRTPGAGGDPLEARPGKRGRRPSPGSSTVRFAPNNRDALSALSSPRRRATAAEGSLRDSRPTKREELPPPVYGPLELPAESDEGPEDGLTLDAAIEMLVRANVDLRSKAFEIPQARADVLTAGLRSNPFVFGSASGYPYQAYSPSRPGENGYSVTVIHPFDLNHKRRARVDVAVRAKQVLEAQYQDAVRLEIDRLGDAFLDVAASYETLRFLKASVAGLNEVLSTARAYFDKGQISEPDYDRVVILRDSAESGMEQAEVALSQAKLALALLINIPSAQADEIVIRSSIRDTAPPPPQPQELLSMALANRPDLMAYRLGIQRARADATLVRKERFSDVFLLYSPYEFRNNVPTHGNNATSWSVGAMATVPLYNRNQGEIRRAALNVAQSQAELIAVERQVESEVEHAAREYNASGRALDRMQRVILPRSARVRDAEHRLWLSGEQSLIDFLNAQRDYNNDVRQYRDAIIRHRRSMLKLNTAVGLRILP